MRSWRRLAGWKRPTANFKARSHVATRTRRAERSTDFEPGGKQEAFAPRYKRILDALPCGVIVIDANDGIVLLINPEAGRLLGTADGFGIVTGSSFPLISKLS